MEQNYNQESRQPVSKKNFYQANNISFFNLGFDWR